MAERVVVNVKDCAQEAYTALKAVELLREKVLSPTEKSKLLALEGIGWSLLGLLINQEL